MNDYGKKIPSVDEPRKIQKVVSAGSAQTKKKSDVKKIADVFISDDIHNVKSYVIFDVLVPRVMDMLSEALKGSVDMIFGGGGRRSKDSRSSNVSYRQYYDDKRDRYRGETSGSRDRFDFDEITFNYRGDAEGVLEQMEATIDRYGLVTVGDMYDMANLPQPHTSNRYGWTNLRNAEVVRRYGKYSIKLPKAMPID